jgi:hypothetical protein
MSRDGFSTEDLRKIMERLTADKMARELRRRAAEIAVWHRLQFQLNEKGFLDGELKSRLMDEADKTPHSIFSGEKSIH